MQGCRLPENWESLVLRVASPESSCHHADYCWKSPTWWSQFNLQWYLCPKFQRKILWSWDWFGFSRTISLPLVSPAMAISRLFVSMLHFHYPMWENLLFRHEIEGGESVLRYDGWVVCHCNGGMLVTGTLLKGQLEWVIHNRNGDGAEVCTTVSCVVASVTCVVSPCSILP